MIGDRRLTPDDARAPRAPLAALASPESLRPVVAAREPRGRPWLYFGGAALAGVLVFAWMSGQRAQGAVYADRRSNVPLPAASTVDEQPPPPDLLAVSAAGRGSPFAPAQASKSAYFQTDPAPRTPVAAALMPFGGATSPQPATIDSAARRRAPSLIVDLSDAGAEQPVGIARQSSDLAPPGPAGIAAAATEAQDKAAAAKLNPDEQFADRIGGEQPDRSRAVAMRNLGATVTQGTIMTGVLETAINSDLPGFVRAVVSRDVRSFDGRQVLIPRGSRLIGQYRSGTAQGQSRAFIIWTRVIRPDGASVQIASSGTDTLGRAGLDGHVDRHFFQMFGGAILLSVLNAGIASLAQQPSTQIVIGSSQQASSLASSALAPNQIPPTITVAQGTPIRIFVARDLDFSSVGADAL
jgi:type IV secretory pathway VirB10-like protein